MTTSDANVTTETVKAPEADAKVTETPKAAEPPKAPAQQPGADKFAQLSATEKRLRKEADKVAADRKALEAERQAHADRLALIERAKAGDWEAREKLLEETGVKYDDLTKRILTKGKGQVSEAQERTAREVAELKAKLEAKEKAEQEAAEKAGWAATVSEFKKTVTSGDAYPLLAGEIEAEPDYIESVLRSLDKAARESGEPITLAEAASRLERYFREQTERRSKRLGKTSEGLVSSTQTSTPPTSPRDQRGRFQPSSGDGPRTLTNGLSAERSSAPKGSSAPRSKMTQRERDLEERERIRRAANAFGR
jgi:uncharacterized cupin superfamily protein